MWMRHKTGTPTRGVPFKNSSQLVTISVIQNRLFIDNQWVMQKQPI